MAADLRIISLRDLISLKPEGELDFEKSQELIQAVASTPGGLIEHDLLVDTRGAESYLTITQLWEIARDLAIMIHNGSPKGFVAKIAVICPKEKFENAKFFELCSQNRGLNVSAFTSFEDMFEWLSSSSSHDPNKG